MIKVTMDDTEMDSFVMCLANRKVCGKMQKDMSDLVSTDCKLIVLIVYLFTIKVMLNDE